MSEPKKQGQGEFHAPPASIKEMRKFTVTEHPIKLKPNKWPKLTK